MMRQGVLQPAAGGNQSQWTWPDNGTTLTTFNINIITKEGIQHQSVQTRDGGV